MPEQFSSLIELLKKIPKDYILPLVIASTGLILFGYGLIVFLYSGASRENENQPQVFTATITPKVTKLVKIDIEGAVLHPGVYSLPLDSRVQDGLIAAGGVSSQADRSWIEKHMNLSAKLVDGGKVYIPRIGESVSAASTGPETGQESLSGSIDINSASESQLDSLSGIGPATVAKIIAGRPYTDIQELVTKKVISQSLFTKIKDQIIAQ